MSSLPLRCGLSVLALAGCGLIEDFTSDREIGHIDVSLDPHRPVIIAPDSVGLATPFIVVVNTFGSSSCTTPDGVALVAAPRLARIVPYDKIQRQGACTADYASRPHQVTVQFTDTGAAIVRAVGRVGAALDSVERVVVVTP